MVETAGPSRRNMGSTAGLRRVFDVSGLLKRLREFVAGVTQVSYGSCAGDPIAWEKDLMRRIREREEAANPDESSAARKRVAN
jgi:hypothetical protein